MADVLLSTLVASGSIKSIQRGLTSVNTGDGSIVLTIPPVNTSKTVLVPGGHTSTSSSPVTSYMSLQSSTSVILAAAASSSLNVTVAWQVVEYY